MLPHVSTKSGGKQNFLQVREFCDDNFYKLFTLRNVFLEVNTLNTKGGSLQINYHLQKLDDITTEK